MKGYDVIRPGLAEAMGWTKGRTIDLPGLTWRDPDGEGGFLPDPLIDAEDAEALETWLTTRVVDLVVRFESEDGTYRVFIRTRAPESPGGSPSPYRVSSAVVGPADEADPARRRRRAIVEATWQILTSDKRTVQDPSPAVMP